MPWIHVRRCIPILSLILMFILGAFLLSAQDATDEPPAPSENVEDAAVEPAEESGSSEPSPEPVIEVTPTESTPEPVVTEVAPEPIVTEITPEPVTETPTDSPEQTPEATPVPTEESTVTVVITEESTEQPTITPETTAVVTEEPTPEPEPTLDAEPEMAVLFSASFAGGEAPQIPVYTLFNVAAGARVQTGSGSVGVSVRDSAVAKYSAVLRASGEVALLRAGTTLATAVTAVSPDAWYDLRLSAIQNTLRVSVDGVELIAIRDDATLPPGGVSFEADGEGALVESFTIWVPASEMPNTVPAEATPEATESFITKSSVPNLASDLDRLYNTRSRGGSALADTAELYNLQLRDGQVKVMLIMLDTESAEDAVDEIEALGGEVTAQYQRWIDAWVPVDALEAVATLPGISLVQRAVMPVIDSDEPSVRRAPELQGIPDPLQTMTPQPMQQGGDGDGATNIDPTLPGATGEYSTRAISAYFERITRDRCQMTIVFVTGDPSTYWLQIWDDGAKIWERSNRATRAGQKFTITYTITEPVGQTALGLGFLVTDSFGTVLTGWDPYPVPEDSHRACANTVISEGVQTSNASAWHQVGQVGDGVSVAIFDVGFAGYEESQAAGELPNDLDIYGTIDTIWQNHGTAVAEIVYDMAPGADFTLAQTGSAVETAVKLIDLAQDHDVINNSWGYMSDTEPGDGTGLLSSAVSEARDTYGALVVQAAGNNRECNWQGQFNDSDGDGFHEFANGVEINEFNGGKALPFFFTLYINMRWNDWDTTDQDYDLLIYRKIGSSWFFEDYLSSYMTQNGTTPPTEGVYGTVFASGIYGFAIYNYNADGDHIMDIGCRWTKLRYNMTSRSLTDPATAEDSFTVAAVDARGARQEVYSSEGPSMGPGGSLGTGVNQPRIAGYATVRNYAFPGFNGTSAASPHVAGAAALVFGAYPAFTADDVAAYLEANAANMGTPGYDYLFGMGRLRLPNIPGIPQSSFITPTHRSFVDSSSPYFEWTGYSGDYLYELQIATDSRFSNIIAYMLPDYVLDYTTLPLSDGKYYARVRVVTETGFQGAWSSVIEFTIDTLPPTVPTLSAPRDMSINNTVTPRLTWRTSPGASLYHIVIFDEGGLVHEGFSTTASYTVPASANLSEDVYSWQVKALDAAGNESDWSGEWAFIVTILRAPLPNAISRTQQPVLSWRGVKGVTYTVQVSTDENFGGVLDFTCTVVGGSSCKPITPLPFNIYYWRVLVNGTDPTVAFKLTVTPAPLPKPTLISPANRAINPLTVLNWSAVTNAVYYEVEVSADSRFRTVLEREFPAGTSFDLGALPPGRWYWRVRAYNFVDVPGAWSSTYSFTIQ